jgi:SHS2 domain-containing protein
MVTRARDPGPLAREIAHTADVGLEVEAPTLPLLFERAGLAVLALMLDLAAVEPRERVALAIDAPGTEELLHDWLQDLAVRAQTGGLVACELEVTHLDACSVRGTAAGERVNPSRHHLYTELKGVTYHQLAVRPTDGGWWARIILDV